MVRRRVAIFSGGGPLRCAWATRVAGPWALPASHCAGTLTPQHLHPCHLEALFLLVAFGWLCAFFIYRISTHKTLCLETATVQQGQTQSFVGMVVLYQSPEYRVYLKIPCSQSGVSFFFFHLELPRWRIRGGIFQGNVMSEKQQGSWLPVSCLYQSDCS